MRLVAICLVLLLLPGHIYASTGERMEMTVRLLDDGRAHVTMVSMDPPNFAELKGIINEPKVVSIYNERLSQVFGDITDLRLYTQDRSVVIEFDCQLGEKNDGVWAVDRTDFKGLVQPASVLRIELPEGAKMLGATPAPSEIQGETLAWNGVDFIPRIEYTEHSTGLSLKYAMVILPVIFLLLVRIFHR